MDREQLAKILAGHKDWLNHKEGGKRADLSDANLSCTDLSRAELSGANLSGSTGVKYAACAWSGHGEKGRQLLAVQLGEICLFCGCFAGSVSELRDYIATDEHEYKASRTKALDFVLSCFEEES